MSHETGLPYHPPSSPHPLLMTATMAVVAVETAAAAAMVAAGVVEAVVVATAIAMGQRQR